MLTAEMRVECKSKYSEIIGVKWEISRGMAIFSIYIPVEAGAVRVIGG